MDLLPQTLIVEKLLQAVIKVLPSLSENEDKKLLLGVLEEFKGVTVPSAIYLSEVQEKIRKQNITVTIEQAYSILEDAALDIDLNYANRAINYHVDEFIMNSID